MDNKQGENITEKDFRDDGSGYGTHLELLKIIFRAFEIKSVVEFGMGNFSTLYFLFKGCSVMSIEMQDKEWYYRMKEKIDSPIWAPLYIQSPGDIYHINYPERIDFAFIDGHQDNRPECINLMFGLAPLIAAHDYEYSGYGWERIERPPGYRQLIFSNNGLKTILFASKLVL